MRSFLKLRGKRDRYTAGYSKCGEGGGCGGTCWCAVGKIVRSLIGHMGCVKAAIQSLGELPMS